jgi:putative endonuclease
MTDRSSRSSDTGSLAEMLVAQWLKQQKWQILAERWHCRWGELDLVAVDPAQPCLAFVEVKARSRGNWDANGLLAITPMKRQKLKLAAELFLSIHPDLAELPCRFDLAMVHCQQTPSRLSVPVDQLLGQTIKLEQPISVGAYRLTLLHYLPAAFE